ncbi:MAG TPA: hypothetical protein VFZ70_02665 [Euzebyales bacterium]
MSETFFRTFGGLVGLVGVLLVAYELDAAIGEYAPLHSAVRRMVRRLQRMKASTVGTWWRLFGRQGQSVTIQVEPAVARATVGTPRVIVDPPDRRYDDFDTDEERIRYLFDRADSADTWVEVIRERARKDRSLALQRQKRLEEKLDGSHEGWRKEVRDLKTGNAGLRFTGFICLGYGVVATAWAQELARWDPPAGGLLLAAWLSTLAWAWTRPVLPE